MRAVFNLPRGRCTTLQWTMSMSSSARHLVLGVAVLLVSLGAFHGLQAETLLEVDATRPVPAPEFGYFKFGHSVSPTGHVIGINSRYLTSDGKPWLPVMGEFHPTRYPSEFWEDEIVKMKSAGVEIISFYIIWAHHEARPGQFDWSGDRDVRRFVALCAKHDMKVVVRIGPWAHAEVRYGGTPEWVVNQTPTRRNDPVYLNYAARYWSEIAAQLKGEFWKDGGPIIGVQIENEYNLVGPGMGVEHIETLKKLALSLGFDAPLYTVTGWDGTTYPKGEVTPVFGGYLDEPWGLGVTKMEPNEVYSFRFNSRVAGNAGAETPGVTVGTAVEDMPHTPFLGAEFAGGLPQMYRRRPLVAPDDVGAMLPVQLGSGVNLYGYYMFHGGRNPSLNLEENAHLGGYNDVPVFNYDFQAPYGEYGESHPVLNTIRPYHLFLQRFGARLAPMSVFAPKKEPVNLSDLTTARYAVRALGDSGFVFLSNYIRQHLMASQKDVRFRIRLPDQTLTFPSRAVTIPTGAYFIWPFNFDMDGIQLAWATAQPLTRIATGANEVTYVFAAQDGIAPELAVLTPKGVRPTGENVVRERGLTLIRPRPSQAVAGVIKARGKTIRLIVVSQSAARMMWVGNVAGMPRLVESKDEISFEDDGLELRATGDPNFRFGIYPALDRTPRANRPLTAAGRDGVFQVFTAAAPQRIIAANVTEIRSAGAAPPVPSGGVAGRALQPYPEDFGRAAAWSIAVPADALDGDTDAFLNIDYQGDIARLFAGPEMLDDDYYFGALWTIGLKRFRAKLHDPLTLTVLPLRKDAPIYLDDAVRAKLPATDQVATIKSVKIVPQYTLRINY
jgi:beta-galactosidase